MSALPITTTSSASVRSTLTWPATPRAKHQIDRIDRLESSDHHTASRRREPYSVIRSHPSHSGRCQLRNASPAHLVGRLPVASWSDAAPCLDLAPTLPNDA